MASRELGLTAAQAGGFMSAFFLGYLLTQLPGGMLADRLGTRKVLLISLLFMGIFTLGMAWVPGFWTGVILRFIAGVGSGAVLAAAVKGVYDHFGPTRRATAMGFFMASSPLGLLVANLLAPAIAAGFGWRASFLAAGGFTLLVLAVSWQVLPRRRRAPPRRRLRAGGNTLRTLIGNRELMLTAVAAFSHVGHLGDADLGEHVHAPEPGAVLKQSGQIMAVFAAGPARQPWPAGWPTAFPVPPAGRHGHSRLLRPAAVAVRHQPGYPTACYPGTLLGAGSFIFGPVLKPSSANWCAAQVGTAIGFCNAVWQLGSVISR
jgi:MFS family permease